ncbi:MAG: pyroglutamyl-peptidase I [Hyphomicrobium sp.]
MLLTGFGPFPGVPDNVSGRLVEKLCLRARRAFAGVTFTSEVLATEWGTAPSRVTALLDELNPLVSLHFGVASGSRTIRIETQAANTCRMSADAAGQPPLSNRLADDGAAVHAANIPVAAIYQRLQRRGIPVSISDDAGGYLCNAVLYHTLSSAKASGRPGCAGFIHLPDDLSRPPLTFPVALKAGLEIIEACLEHARR